MDVSTLEALMVQNNELLAQIYVAQLYVIGVCGGAVVLYLLYKFLRLFF